MSKTNFAEVMIGGVNVKFPNKPYPSQISMMGKVEFILLTICLVNDDKYAHLFIKRL